MTEEPFNCSGEKQGKSLLWARMSPFWFALSLVRHPLITQPTFLYLHFTLGNRWQSSFPENPACAEPLVSWITQNRGYFLHMDQRAATVAISLPWPRTVRALWITHRGRGGTHALTPTLPVLLIPFVPNSLLRLPMSRAHPGTIQVYLIPRRTYKETTDFHMCPLTFTHPMTCVLPTLLTQNT